MGGAVSYERGTPAGDAGRAQAGQGAPLLVQSVQGTSIYPPFCTESVYLSVIVCAQSIYLQLCVHIRNRVCASTRRRRTGARRTARARSSSTASSTRGSVHLSSVVYVHLSSVVYVHLSSVLYVRTKSNDSKSHQIKLFKPQQIKCGHPQDAGGVEGGLVGCSHAGRVAFAPLPEQRAGYEPSSLLSSSLLSLSSSFNFYK